MCDWIIQNYDGIISIISIIIAAVSAWYAYSAKKYVVTSNKPNFILLTKDRSLLLKNIGNSPAKEIFINGYKTGDFHSLFINQHENVVELGGRFYATAFPGEKLLLESETNNQASMNLVAVAISYKDQYTGLIYHDKCITQQRNDNLISSIDEMQYIPASDYLDKILSKHPKKPSYI